MPDMTAALPSRHHVNVTPVTAFASAPPRYADFADAATLLIFASVVNSHATILALLLRLRYARYLLR